MRVAIVGAGIVGVTTAFELADAGHEVTVFERRPVVAAEASFANAGIVAPGYIASWATPGMPWRLTRQMLGSLAMPWRGGGTSTTLPWIWRHSRACRARDASARRREVLHRLASLSRDRLEALGSALGLQHEEARGLLVLMRTARELEQARPGLAALESLGVAFEVVDAERARSIEPGISPAAELHAALHLPQDRVGNCRQFAHLLRREAERRGAIFLFEREVRRIVPGPSPTMDVVRCADATQIRDTVADPVAFDAIVVCAGAAAAALLRPHGMRLPILPVWGHTITAPLRTVESHPEIGPRAALVDARLGATITRLGQRVRVAGGAAIVANAGASGDRTLELLYRALDDWFPGAARLAQAQSWKGARPTMPDGLPALGASGTPGIWLNVGHGASGWTLACGSAMVLADALSDRAPEVDFEPLQATRWR